jgi:acyl-CoA dehydrogenase
MDFRLSSEQQMLRDSARRFASTELEFSKRRRRIADGVDEWPAMAELGWFMLAVPEAAGGLGGPLVDLAILAEELGRGLALSQYITGAVLPARLLWLSDGQRQAAILEQLALGTQRFAAALYEADRRYELDQLGCIAQPLPDGSFKLSGEKPLVMGGAEADWLIVAARRPDDPSTALFLVSSLCIGVSRRHYLTIDNLSASDVKFDEVHLPSSALLAFGPKAAASIELAVDEAAVLLCADAIGCMDRTIEMTAEYLRTRKQFGQTLASFQALQHGIANLFIEANDARSILYRAIAACSGTNRMARRKAVSACKYKVMESARLVAGQAVHFHGGIGMTCDYPVGEFLRRILVAEQSFGNAQYHFERYLSAAGHDV